MSKRYEIIRGDALVLLGRSPDVLKAIPHAVSPMRDILMVPHRPSETRVLRNLGYDIESPVLVHYAFPGATPFEVQRATVELMTMHPRCYILNNFGTGKTLSALWAFDYLRSVKEAKRLLVVAPLSTLRFVWEAEIYKRLPHLRPVVLHGSKTQRVLALQQPADVYIINHDGLRVLADELSQRSDIDCVVVDELTAFRSAAAQRSRVARALFNKKPFLWGMTGSPTPNAPSDAHGQLLLVRPESVVRSASAFRDAVMYKVGQFRWVPRADAPEILAKLFTPAVRFSLDDVIELPDITYREVNVPVSEEAKVLYGELQRWMITYLTDAATAATTGAAQKAGDATAKRSGQNKIVAAHEGALWAKLLQVSLGYVYGSATIDGEERRVSLPVWPEARLDALIDTLNDVDGKVIVWVPYLHAMQGVHERLEAEGITHRVVSGDTPQRERAMSFSDFQRDPTLRVLVAHPRCAAHGITLTAARVCIWYGPVADQELFEQANARIRRVGQTGKQLILMFCGFPIERKVYERLRHKQSLQGRLLGLLREVTQEEQARRSK